MLQAIVVIFFGLAGVLLPMTARAFDLKKGEVLHYLVYWGPLKMGHTELDYVPQTAGKSDGYTVRVHVWDESSFINMDDVWQSNGVHAPKHPFTPVTYEALQKENSYRADKVVTFDAKAKRIVYANRRDANDKAQPFAWDGMMRDALSAVYAWRLEEIGNLQKGGSVEVMGVKRPFTLIRAPAKRETVLYGGKDVTVWSVDLTTATDGKKGKDSWTVKLRDDGKLTPIVVVARNKFGTFRATLKE